MAKIQDIMAEIEVKHLYSNPVEREMNHDTKGSITDRVLTSIST